MKDKRVADNDRFDAFIEEKCKQHHDKLWRDLELGQNDKVDAMIGKKCKKHYDKWWVPKSVYLDPLIYIS
jgi:hypothetical protein